MDVYQLSFKLAMEIYELSKHFPREETHSLTDQVRRASRSVAANLTEAWRKRRYRAAFVSKLSDAETESAETQTWVSFAVQCGYLSSDAGDRLRREYDQVIAKIVTMMIHADEWLVPAAP